MEKAIEVLQKQVETCNNMAEFYINELATKFSSITSDTGEKFVRQQQKIENDAIRESCSKAIELLRAKNIS